jgi:hypothetical protein
LGEKIDAFGEPNDSLLDPLEGADGPASGILHTQKDWAAAAFEDKPDLFPVPFAQIALENRVRSARQNLKER